MYKQYSELHIPKITSSAFREDLLSFYLKDIN